MSPEYDAQPWRRGGGALVSGPALALNPHPSSSLHGNGMPATQLTVPFSAPTAVRTDRSEWIRWQIPSAKRS